VSPNLQIGWEHVGATLSVSDIPISV